MPVYKLAPTSAPVKFLDDQLHAVKLPSLKLVQGNYVLRSGNEGELRAFIDMRSGDTEFIPDLAELVRTAQTSKPMEPERAESIARAIYGNESFIPKDSTQLRLANPITVMGDATSHGLPVAQEPITVMTMVPAVRYAFGFKIYGLGSHAVVTLANNGSLIGVVRRWRTASPAGLIQPNITAEQVRADILRQLRPLVATKGTTAVVDKIELAYYDNNKNYLQPVYHFAATLRPSDRRVSPIRVSGFIPIGKLLEPVPDLAAPPSGKLPAKAAPPNPTVLRGGIGTAPSANDITLGEYANRDWPYDSGYVSMSNSFLDGLTFLDSLVPGLMPPVTRTQWYEAWPWEVVGPSSRDYLNAVNVAYTVPHG